MDIALFKLTFNAVSSSCECGQILPRQGLSHLLLYYYREAGKNFAKYYNVVKGTVLLFIIFVCLCMRML